MGDNIRVSRKPDVGEMVQDVLNNKVRRADTHDYQASLHSLYGRHEKHIQNERDVLHEVIHANLLMARAIAALTGRIANLEKDLAEQPKTVD